MGAAHLVVRIGAELDTLAVIGATSDQTLRRLRVHFGDWLDDLMLEELAGTSPGFVIQLDRTAPAKAGPRSLPHLRYGSEVIARGTPDAVLGALESVLGVIHHRSTDDDRPWVTARVFTDGTTAILTDLPRPHLVGDRRLLEAGISEIVNWGVLVADGSVTVPAPIGSGDGARFRLAGLVTFEPDLSSLGERVARLAARSAHPGWFSTVASLAEQGQIVTVGDRQTARRAILDSFSQFPHTQLKTPTS